MASAGKWSHAKTEYRGTAVSAGLLQRAARFTPSIVRHRRPSMLAGTLGGSPMCFRTLYDVRAISREPGSCFVILTHAIRAYACHRAMCRTLLRARLFPFDLAPTSRSRMFVRLVRPFAATEVRVFDQTCIARLGEMF
ncbi:hypothetical protein WS96_07640 [Burkholderia sp. MSMB1835]|nr:hypothetical protein WS96_07640 [Burkholderia sp. MSMB1835]